MYNEKAMLAYEHMKETVGGFNEEKKNTEKYNQKFLYACRGLACLELDSPFEKGSELDEIYYDFMYFYHMWVLDKKDCEFKRHTMRFAKQMLEKCNYNPFVNTETQNEVYIETQNETHVESQSESKSEEYDETEAPWVLFGGEEK